MPADSDDDIHDESTPHAGRSRGGYGSDDDVIDDEVGMPARNYGGGIGDTGSADEVEDDDESEGEAAPSRDGERGPFSRTGNTALRGPSR